MFEFFKKTKKINRKELEIFFDKQIERLKNLKVDENLINIFENQKEEVLNRAEKIDFDKEDTYFFPVIPRTENNLNYLLSLINGETEIKEFEIEDVNPANKEPYYIFKLSRGDNSFGRGAQKRKKNALNLGETISWLIHENDLIKYINCTGTSFKKTDISMFLIRSKDNSFRLYLGKIYTSYYFVPRGER